MRTAKIWSNQGTLAIEWVEDDVCLSYTPILSFIDGDDLIAAIENWILKGER